MIDFWEDFSWKFYLLLEFSPEIFWEEVAEGIFSSVRFDVWLGAYIYQANTLATRLHRHQFNFVLPNQSHSAA